MVKYRTNSGRIFTFEELKELYLKTHPHETEIGFEVALLLAVEEYRTVKEIIEDTTK